RGAVLPRLRPGRRELRARRSRRRTGLREGAAALARDPRRARGAPPGPARRPRGLRPPGRGGSARGRRGDRRADGMGAARAQLAPSDAGADLRPADDGPRSVGGEAEGVDRGARDSRAARRRDPEPVRAPRRTMSGLLAIWRRELAALFLGPLAWTLLF